MDRLVKNVILGISIALAVGASALWKWSFGQREQLAYEWSSNPERGTRLIMLQMVWGQMSIRWADLQTPKSVPPGYMRQPIGWSHLSSPTNGQYTELPQSAEGLDWPEGRTIRSWRGFQYESYKIQTGYFLYHMGTSDSDTTYMAGSVRELWVPLWALTLFFWIPPTGIVTRRAIRRLRARRLQAHCGKCNYDLRAHGPGQTCPECGASIPTK